MYSARLSKNCPKIDRKTCSAQHSLLLHFFQGTGWLAYERDRGKGRVRERVKSKRISRRNYFRSRLFFLCSINQTSVFWGIPCDFTNNERERPWPDVPTALCQGSPRGQAGTLRLPKVGLDCYADQLLAHCRWLQASLKGELLFSSVEQVKLIHGHWLCSSSKIHQILAQ